MTRKNSVFSRIHSEYGKIRTRKNSVFGHFSHKTLQKYWYLTWLSRSICFSQVNFLWRLFSTSFEVINPLLNTHFLSNLKQTKKQRNLKCIFLFNKSILIHESQPESTRFNANQHEPDTGQHKSTLVRHESTRINTIPTTVSTNQHQSNTSQRESRQVGIESTRV